MPQKLHDPGPGRPPTAALGGRQPAGKHIPRSAPGRTRHACPKPVASRTAPRRSALASGPRPEGELSDLRSLSSAPLRGRGPLARPGDHSARAPPDPIPNSAVKPRRAQGTAPKGVGERVVARSGQGPPAALRSPHVTTRFPPSLPEGVNCAIFRSARERFPGRSAAVGYTFARTGPAQFPDGATLLLQASRLIKAVARGGAP